MFLHFLDQSDAGSLRSILREWYFIGVVRKKASKYDIMGKLRNVEYVKSEQSYVVNFELGSVICSGSHIYDQDFLFDKSR